MHQRQLRLGDTLDDYCPRERRLTNHVVVAMVEADVKRTRCTTCDTEHEYKHAKVPRQRRKAESPAALYSQVLASGPKRVVHEAHAPESHEETAEHELSSSSDEIPSETASEATRSIDELPRSVVGEPSTPEPVAASADTDETPDGESDDDRDDASEEGPVHRPLIRATLPRPEGQPPPARPAPDFTVRQPGGRANRFRPRHQRGPFQGNRNGNMPGGGPMRGGAGRPMGGGRPPQGGGAARMARRHGPRKKSR